LQKLRLFQNIAIAEAVVEVRSQERDAFDQEATASQLFVARCEVVRAQLIRFLPDNVRAPLALTVSKPGAAALTGKAVMLRYNKLARWHKNVFLPMLQQRMTGLGKNELPSGVTLEQQKDRGRETESPTRTKKW